MVIWGLGLILLLSVAGVVWLVVSAARADKQVTFRPLVDYRVGRFRALAAERLGDARLAELAIPVAVEGASGLSGLPSAPTNGVQAGASSSSFAKSPDAAMWAAAGVDVVIPIAEKLHQWLSVDEKVFKAFEHLSHQPVEDMSDLFRLVQERNYAFETDAFVRKMIGHVGEQHAAEHFHEAGVAVAMPMNSNEPAFDMQLDGHEVNIKTWKDASDAAYQHFRDHPDVAVVVPGDAQNIPEGALNLDPSLGFDTSLLENQDHVVIVDKALSYAELHGDVHNATDVLAHPDPAPHIPWVTMGVSAFREGKLLMNGSTDLSRAAKNVTVDTVAVGGGALAGAKAGAIIGSFFGPGIGTAIGGAIGGVVGGLAGRQVGNSIKRAPLDEAKEQLDSSRSEYTGASSRVEKEASEKWSHARDSESKHYSEVLTVIDDDSLADLARIAARVRRSMLPSQVEISVTLEQAEQVLINEGQQVIQNLQAKIPLPLKPWAGRVFPKTLTVIESQRQEVCEWQRRKQQILSRWEESPEAVCMAFDHVLAAPGGDQLAEAHIEMCVAERAQGYLAAAHVVKRAEQAVLKERTASVGRLTDALASIRDQAERQLRPVIARLQRASDTLAAELRKAGISPA